MERGYVKLWRKSLETVTIKNHKLWVVWCYCLLKASHKPRQNIVGFQTVNLEPGQFVFGRKRASKDLKMGEQSIRTCIATLKHLGQIDVKSTNKFSVISIVNWDAYQPDKKQTNQQLTSNQPATNHKQECKELKEVYTSNFLAFWKSYPRKVGKGAAYKSWKRIKKFDGFMDSLFTALNIQKESDQWARNNGQFIPHPTTWLNQRRWEDETETVKREMEYL